MPPPLPPPQVPQAGHHPRAISEAIPTSPIFGIGSSSRSDFDVPLVILRVQILSCHNLEAKHRNGYSDPCARLLVISPALLSSSLTFPSRSSRFCTVASWSSLFWEKNSRLRCVNAILIPSINRKTRRSSSQFTYLCTKLLKSLALALSSLMSRTKSDPILWANMSCL